MFKEFREFAFKGNMIDLAVGVIIGGAFGKVITSVVNDLIMPLIGMLMGKLNLENMFIPLDGKTYTTLKEAMEAGAPIFKYGVFLSNMLDFLIVAFTIFFVLKQLARFRKKEAPKEPEPVTTKECPKCLSEVPVKATRCKFCTSELAVEVSGTA
jgi:large conductance mechanosensitive channel